MDGSGHQDPLTTDLPGRHHSPWKARKEEPARKQQDPQKCEDSGRI